MVGKGRSITHVNACTDDGPSTDDGAQGRWDQGSHRGEEDRRIQLLGGFRIRGASPGGP
jgi:hypothetical protein